MVSLELKGAHKGGDHEHRHFLRRGGWPRFLGGTRCARSEPITVGRFKALEGDPEAHRRGNSLHPLLRDRVRRGVYRGLQTGGAFRSQGLLRAREDSYPSARKIISWRTSALRSSKKLAVSEHFPAQVGVEAVVE